MTFIDEQAERNVERRYAAGDVVAECPSCGSPERNRRWTFKGTSRLCENLWHVARPVPRVVAECWTCAPEVSLFNGPCLGCGAFGKPHDAMEHHRAAGHDVRERHDHSVCPRCHGRAAVEDCVVCAAYAQVREHQEAQGGSDERAD